MQCQLSRSSAPSAAVPILVTSPGWTLRLDVDDEPVAFCPECDVREFGGG
jgi:hypothetical protein